MAKKTPKSKPVLIQGGTLFDMLNEISNQPPPPPRTEEENKKIESLLKQLADSQGPGDSFMMINIQSKKSKN